MKVLITEIGNNNSGDESICLGAARRLLSMEAEVTFCYRVSLEAGLNKAGLDVPQVYMPVESAFEGVNSSSELIRAFAEEMPELYQEMKQLIEKHDVLAIAPGGKFTDGYKNARTLLAAAFGKSLGLKVIVLHQSVGPIENSNHRKLLAEVFGNCDLLLIRDEQSCNFLLKLGVSSHKIVRCRDVAMGEIYPEPIMVDYNLGLNIRYGPNGHIDLEALSQFISGYNSYFPYDRILVYSTTYNLPSNVVEHLSNLPCEQQIMMPTYPDYLKEVGRCAINISDSFHGCIFSMMANRPVVCCQTDYKTWKLRGLPAPEQKPLKVLPGLMNSKEAKLLLSEVVNVRNNPDPLLRYQNKVAKYGRELCEEGWAAVQKTLNKI